MGKPQTTTAGIYSRASGDVVLVTVTKARGSSPRDAGAFMLVSAEEVAGTIGGGSLEYLALGHARELLKAKAGNHNLDIPLGPEIGQCCGGRVELEFEVLSADRYEVFESELDAQNLRLPHVYIFGAGHTGHALARSLSLLPLNVTIVDPRQDLIDQVPDGVEAICTALPEAVIRAAPGGSCFIVMTHEHSLDFLITAEALKHQDAAYVGMIGSKTKKASFAKGVAKDMGVERQMREELICPIGAAGMGDKRPEVIAAFVTAELLEYISKWEVAQNV